MTFSVVFAYVADITQEHERSMAYGLVYAVFLYIQILCMLILRSLSHIYTIGRPSPPHPEGIREKTVIKADKAPVLHPASLFSQPRFATDLRILSIYLLSIVASWGWGWGGKGKGKGRITG